MLSRQLLSGEQNQRTIRTAQYVNEELSVNELLNEVALPEEQHERVRACAETLIQAVRAGKRDQTGLESLLQEYALSAPEGVALMCLAEAFLRIPDKATANRLIRDKLGPLNWETPRSGSSGLIVNTLTWGLQIAGRVVRPAAAHNQPSVTVLKKLMARGGEPFIRAATRRGMEVMGRQFVLGRNMEEALKELGISDEDGEVKVEDEN